MPGRKGMAAAGRLPLWPSQGDMGPMNSGRPPARGPAAARS